MWNYALQQQGSNLQPMGYAQCFVWLFGFFLVAPLVVNAIGRLAGKQMPTSAAMVEAWLTGWLTGITMVIGFFVALWMVSPVIGGIILALVTVSCSFNGDAGTALRALMVTFTPFLVLLVYGGATRTFNLARRLNGRLRLVSL